jgi:hypothetical protein
VTSLQAFLTRNNSSSNEPRAILWENTLHQVVQLLREAEKRIRTPAGQARYTALEGWWRNSSVKLAGRGTTKIPSEEALSEAIVDEIQLLREEMVLAPRNSNFLNIDSLEFTLEAPRRHKKGIGKHSKPTDIRVYRLGSEVIDLRIEAKTLVQDKDISTYLSARGLKRFSDPDEPYTDHEIGGMLAYTVTDTSTIWTEKISGSFRSAAPPIPNFKHALLSSSDETLFCSVPYQRKPATSRKEVLVFHLVLEFDSDPAAR